MSKKKTWLLLDCNYLCHRAFHAFKELEYKEVATGVLFGFLHDVSSLVSTFDTPRLVFCFDSSRSVRKKVLPSYKSSRKTRHDAEPDEDREKRKELQRQISIIRKQILPKLGYRNIFYQVGYEADDIIGSIVKRSLSKKDEAIIVSSDQDLYQLLRDNVSIYNPHQHKTTTNESFFVHYKIPPKWWPDVKAIAGCSTDDVLGIKGIGEKTAIKYLRNKLGKTTRAYFNIENDDGIVYRNMRIVQLPYPGTQTFDLLDDMLDVEAWKEITEEYGMHSIRDVSLLVRRRKTRAKSKSKGFGL
jgi:DNA polymerase-1